MNKTNLIKILDELISNTEITYDFLPILTDRTQWRIKLTYKNHDIIQPITKEIVNSQPSWVRTMLLKDVELLSKYM